MNDVTSLAPDSTTSGPDRVGSGSSFADRLEPALPTRVHLLGLGGAGVSGAARLLARRGHAVSGHDRVRTPFLEGLADDGVAIHVGASTAEALPSDVEAVVRSAAVGLDDPQVRAALERGVPVLKYAELLPRLWRPGRTLAVAGTHGKTTTTWMVLHALEGVAARVAVERGGDEQRPGALVGGLDLARGTNAIAPAKDGWFALEACEYDRSFLTLSPFAAVITNVEADHLDCYEDLDGVVNGFARFARTVATDGLLVLGDEVPAAVEHAARCLVWRLGRELDLAIRDVEGGCAFDVRGPGFAIADVHLAVPGRAMALDAALAIALALGTLPIDARAAAAPDVAAHVARYRGAARRFERWGTFGERVLVHDYAHHPTELDAVLEAARSAYPGRPVHAYFQPHQHSRTAHLFDDFVDALAAFDGVVLTEVYGARTHIDGAHFTGSSALADALAARGRTAAFEADLERGAVTFARSLPNRAVALVLGAGDVEDVRGVLERELASARALDPIGS